MTYAATSNNATTAPHSKNAALRNQSESPYQQRTTQKDNPTQQSRNPQKSTELQFFPTAAPRSARCYT